MWLPGSIALKLRGLFELLHGMPGTYVLPISGPQLSYAIMKSTSEDIVEGLWTLPLPYRGRRPFTDWQWVDSRKLPFLTEMTSQNLCHPSWGSLEISFTTPSLCKRPTGAYHCSALGTVSSLNPSVTRSWHPMKPHCCWNHVPLTIFLQIFSSLQVWVHSLVEKKI